MIGGATKTNSGYRVKVPKILIVDDEPNVVKSLHRMMRKWSYHVYTAGSGFRAALLLENMTPDLVVLDINMPHVNGYDVINHIRRDTSHRKQPKILVISGGTPSDISRALVMGADDFLEKPFSKEKLFNTLQGLFSEKPGTGGRLKGRKTFGFGVSG